MDIPVVGTGGAAADLAAKYGFPILTEPTKGYYLCFEQEVLKLKNADKGKNFSIHIDFDKELEKLKRQRLGPKKDILCRAVGYQGQENYLVCDATLGFGKDAIHLVSFGCSVLGIERDPLVFALLEDALLRSQEARQYLQIVHSESLDFLLQKNTQWDCLYIDPMFEDVQSKSQPKKNMAFLRERQPPQNHAQWVSELIEHGGKRVVVKRPLKGGKLKLNPTSSMEGKLIRFDIYRGEND